MLLTMSVPCIFVVGLTVLVFSTATAVVIVMVVKNAKEEEQVFIATAKGRNGR